MAHGFSHRMEPLTLVQYDVDCEDILDLRDPETQKALGIPLADMSGAWMPPHGQNSIAPTWDIADALIETGTAGILVPSFAPGAKLEHFNLVLWQWSDTLPHKVTVYDPQRKLPIDQQSWRQD
ncbi:Uncharacterized conserved protein [Pannonibacter phragmitetus]|uniref:Uncharacterized conserved protein n=2 Tax=Pannonibacter phragmitetus TaxID=121719 RepID=A0A379A171_9HYPH|nr:Uncharacterized conserved protein [Pannonibacter phragmitetus]